MTKELVQYHEDRIAYWVSVGAVMADSVKKLEKLNKRKKKQEAEVKAFLKKLLHLRKLQQNNSKES